MKKYNLGIDIGGTSIKIGLFDLEGNLLQTDSIRTNKTSKGSFILPELADYIKHKFTIEDIRGIGIGVPGPVAKNMIYSCVNLGWGEKDIVKEFKELLAIDDIIVRVANDANLAAAGEIYKGVASGYINAFMVTLGTGIGGGVIIDGRVVDGINGVAGEIGHTHIDDLFNLDCNCGKSGCLETVASATGIVRLAKEYLRKSNKPSKLRRYPEFSAKKVIDFAKAGDDLATEIIDKSMEYLARVLAKVTYIINPDIFIIGGGISNAGNFIIEKIKKYYYPLVVPFISHTNFEIATLGNEAGMFGACYLVK
ncbi:MAG: ROK family glucokinase [Candidatus Izemoplasmatales bacterium]|jgi:glucokinase|nr:ROK family glucokinase [Candidatus Izemoplasmatales bacterium]